MFEGVFISFSPPEGASKAQTWCVIDHRASLLKHHNVLPRVRHCDLKQNINVVRISNCCIGMCEFKRHREKKKVQAGENKRFKRDCQNVTGGNGSGEVERSQFEVEQKVEAIISVSVSLRVAQCDVSGFPSSVCTDEDMHIVFCDLRPFRRTCCTRLRLTAEQPLSSGSACVGCNDPITFAGVTLVAAVTAERERACF